MLGSRLCYSDKACTLSCTSPPPPLPPIPPKWARHITKPFPTWIIILIVCILVCLGGLFMTYMVYRRVGKKKQQQIGDQDCELRSKNGSTASTRNLVPGNASSAEQAK